MVARNIRIITINQFSRDVEKNAMIVRATAKRAEFANKPMSNLLTIIFTQTIKE